MTTEFRMTDKTAGPAYPVTVRRNKDMAGLEGGMTLLDHFAGLAMQGMLAAGRQDEDDELARYAYRQASAMLRGRTEYLGEKL